MTQASLLKMFAAAAIAMLIAVSSVAFAQADTTYTDDGTLQTTSVSEQSSADAAAPGIPNTGAVDATDPLTLTLLILAAIAVVGTVGYFLTRPRDTYRTDM
jgi:hypothetical protein